MSKEAEKKLRGIFNSALATVSGYVAEGLANCSLRVKFCGLTEAVDQPVTLAQAGGDFSLRVSRHFLQNKDDKFEKLFTRYIVTTNVDGSFKTYDEVRLAVRKLPFERHYDVTFQNDYLLSDIEGKRNGVICDRCGRAFSYPPGSPILTKTNRFICRCGGSLVAIIDGVKQFTSNTIDRYIRLNFTKSSQTVVNLEEFSKFSEDVQISVEQLLSGITRPTARQLQPLVKSLLDSEDREVLLAIDEVYRLACDAIYRTLPADEFAAAQEFIGREIPPEPPREEIVEPRRRGARARRLPIIPVDLPEITRDPQLDELFFGELMRIDLDTISKPTATRRKVDSSVDKVDQPTVAVNHPLYTPYVGPLDDDRLNEVFFDCGRSANVQQQAEAEVNAAALTDEELNEIFWALTPRVTRLTTTTEQLGNPAAGTSSPSTGPTEPAVSDVELNEIFFGSP